MVSLEKAQREIETGTLTADSENAVLSSMGDVLQHLKCGNIDDLRRADSSKFTAMLTVGRVLVFAVMLFCIVGALPLTLAFNQLSAVNQEIDVALADEKIRLFVDNEIEMMKIQQKL